MLTLLLLSLLPTFSLHLLQNDAAFLQRIPALSYSNYKKTHSNAKNETVIVFRRYFLPSFRFKRAATASKDRVWPQGVIPYLITANFSGEHKNLFLRAMRHWENHTCVSFVPRKKHHKHYITFTVDKCGCCSYVGRRGDGPQAISIGKNCDKFGIVVHELGHVVGFWHEHTRPDRELYVDIFYKSIQPGQDYNFEKSKPEEVDSLGEPYDFNSIMHYARDTFSRGQFHDTILPKPSFGFRSEIGQRIQLSEGDIRQAKKLYRCPACGSTLMWDSASIVPNAPGICVWRIVAPEANTIFLNITGAGLRGPLRGCGAESNNLIVVRDGTSVKAPIIDKICGDDVGYRTVVSTTNRLYIEMRTEVSLAGASLGLYHSVCGGPLFAQHGVIQSPRYPEGYPPNSDCLWTITVSEGHQTALEIMFFHVEQHKDCIYDRLQIWEGDEVSRPLATLCGNSPPKYIVTMNSNKMNIRFMSDNSVQKGGFELKWSSELDECQTGSANCEQLCVNHVGGYHCDCRVGYSLRADGISCESTCGGHLRGSNGVLRSPNFPRPYPSSKTCVWEIEADPGYQIFINFTTFNVEGMKSECAYDYVRIGDNEKLCGEYGEPVVFTSAMNRVRVEFHSDTSVERQGFSGHFIADLDECQHDNAHCEHTCHNRIGSYICACQAGYVLSSDGHNCKEGGCFFELNAPNEIGMASFGSHYQHDRIHPMESYSLVSWIRALVGTSKSCKWTEDASYPNTFVSFQIEEHSKCKYDSLSVFDGGDPTSTPFGTFCGLASPSLLISSSNELFISFTSDASVTRNGFDINYSSVCGGQLSAESAPGHIYSHATYSDNKYPKSQDCWWRVSAGRDRGVRLQFTSFDVESEQNCLYDYVEVYDGLDSKPSALFGRFCSDDLPPLITSTGSDLLIILHTDDSEEEKGFVAEYRESARSSRRQRLLARGKAAAKTPRKEPINGQ